MSKIKSSQTNRIKNLVIVFGVGLNIFALSSINNWKIKSVDSNFSNEIEMKINKPESSIEKLITAKKELKIKTHHNFIASYLLQGSSIERKITKSKFKRDIFTSIKRLHKIVITQAIGYL